MRQTVVKLAESAVKQDKNGNNYKTVKFSIPSFVQINGEKIYQQSRPVSINLYEKSYLPGNPMDFGYDVPVNSKFFGNVETRLVQPYSFIDSTGNTREAKTYSCVVLGNTDSPTWELLVKATMLRRGHEVLDTQVESTQELETEEFEG